MAHGPRRPPIELPERARGAAGLHGNAPSPRHRLGRARRPRRAWVGEAHRLVWTGPRPSTPTNKGAEHARDPDSLPASLRWRCPPSPPLTPPSAHRQRCAGCPLRRRHRCQVQRSLERHPEPQAVHGHLPGDRRTPRGGRRAGRAACYGRIIESSPECRPGLRWRNGRLTPGVVGRQRRPPLHGRRSRIPDRTAGAVGWRPFGFHDGLRAVRLAGMPARFACVAAAEPLLCRRTGACLRSCPCRHLGTA